MGLDIFVRSKKQKDSECYTNWRKHNFVMGWLRTYDYDEVDINCKDIVLTEEMTKDLRNKCYGILALYKRKRNWQTVAETVLPPYQGFFFGSYELDEYYIQDIQHVYDTIIELTKKYDTYELVLHVWW